MATLFESNAQRPLADSIRPTSIADVVGQEHLLGSDAPLGRMIKSGRISSMILWGPPGTGKTTIGRLLAAEGTMEFSNISAVFSGVSDLRKAFDSAKKAQKLGRGTLLFVDEIHRFNKLQQDGFLPYVENGTVVLVGATTENPSFALNNAILSRVQVYVLKRLGDEVLEGLLTRAESHIGHPLPINTEARQALRKLADGDGRYLLNMAEELLNRPDKVILDTKDLANAVQRRMPLYDKSDDSHYNLISALHKSLRGSDTDAALYWLARMFEGGEDPSFIMRRLTRFAVEDIGLADPSALTQSIAAWDAYDRLGSPEGELAIAQCVIYLGTAPKSNSSYKAEKLSRKVARETGSLMPPKHILNAPTKMMKGMGYGQGYIYDHDQEDSFSGQNYFPEGIKPVNFYTPNSKGFEREIAKRLKYWNKIRFNRTDY